MAKKVTPAQVKAAKQKKIAIGLSVLLVGVAAIQGPKMLKMMKGPSVPAAAAPAATTPAPTGTPAAPTAAAPAGAPPAAGQPAVLASSDTAGQLLSFELFESKDPFTQQVDANAQAASSSTAPAKPAATAPAPATTTAPDGSAPGGSAAPGATGGTTPPTPFAPVAEPAAATTISVNDVSGPAEIGKEFPTDDPIFVLVSTASDGKSAQIGIAGGSYANGEKTITLKLGKPLTLQNTADGTRYELVLETVAGFAPPKAKK